MREQTKILSALAKRLAIVERKLSVPSSFGITPTRVPVDTGTTISSSTFSELGSTNTQMTLEIPRAGMILVIAIMADVVIASQTATTRTATALWNGSTYYSNYIYHQGNATDDSGRSLGCQVLVPTIPTAGTWTFTLRGRREQGDGTCVWNATHSGIALINAYG